MGRIYPFTELHLDMINIQMSHPTQDLGNQNIQVELP